MEPRLNSQQPATGPGVGAASNNLMVPSKPSKSQASKAGSGSVSSWGLSSHALQAGDASKVRIKPIGTYDFRMLQAPALPAQVQREQEIEASKSASQRRASASSVGQSMGGTNSSGWRCSSWVLH